MKILFVPSLFFGCLLALGCGDDVMAVDAAIADAASTDATTADAATMDAATMDAATMDAAMVDAAMVDATMVDATMVDASEPPDDIEVMGTWDNSFSAVEEISNTAWGPAAVISYDNEMNFAITQNASDAIPPDTFNRLEWTEIEANVFHYCTVDFGLGTAADAENTEQRADASDLAAGCGGFAWTQMTRTE